MSFLFKFFQLSYWFDLRPDISRTTLKGMLIFFGLMIAIGVVLKIYKEFKELEKFQSKLLERYFSLLVVMGIIGVAMTWLRSEYVNLLSARFWQLIWLAVFGAWLYPIIKYQFQVAPEAKKRAEEKKLFQKYLPKKK